jgi:crossover junction endodeoxyribonuclease RuvC
MDNRIILGIDPGTNILGYAIIEILNKKIQLRILDIIKLNSTLNHFEKLSIIYKKINDVIIQEKITEMAIEAPFFGKNVQSMLKLGRAQGVSIAAGLSNNLNVNEYSPRLIKQSITGKGNSSKEQVAEMLIHLNILKEVPKYLDATDALAVAVCHYYKNSTIKPDNKSIKNNTTNSWKSFISKNPERLR